MTKRFSRKVATKISIQHAFLKGFIIYPLNLSFVVDEVWEGMDTIDQIAFVFDQRPIA